MRRPIAPNLVSPGNESSGEHRVNLRRASLALLRRAKFTRARSRASAARELYVEDILDREIDAIHHDPRDLILL